jgi:hypothetical protein
MQVQCHDVDEACCGEAWECSALTRGWVTDAKAAVREGEEEEAVAGGVDLEAKVVIKPEDGMAALEDWIGIGCAIQREEGVRRLAPVVGEDKIAGGGESAPGAADSTTAEDILGRETDKDLPHQDVLWEGDGGSGSAAASPRRYSR